MEKFVGVNECADSDFLIFKTRGEFVQLAGNGVMCSNFSDVLVCLFCSVSVSVSISISLSLPLSRSWPPCPIRRWSLSLSLGLSDSSCRA